MERREQADRHDLERRGNTTSYVYDGDGQRIMKTELGSTTVYINGFYEKNVTSGEETRHYLLGGREVATLYYVAQDHLGSNGADH